MCLQTNPVVWAGSVIVYSEVKVACSDIRDVVDACSGRSDDDESIVLP